MWIRFALLVCAITILNLAPRVAAADAARQAKTILQTAAGSEQFSTFLAAVKASGLVDALSGEGPFTVFVPTDEAFAELPPGTITSLLKPQNKQQLQGVVKFHVVAGAHSAADVLQKNSLSSLEGRRLQVKQNKQGATVNGAQLTKTDIRCSNGVIHVIDAVLLPGEQ